MEYIRTVHIWDIEQLLIYYDRHRLIFTDIGINEQVIKDIFANHSIGSILIYNYLDESNGNTYFKILKGEQVSSIINYYRRNKNNWSMEEKKAFLLFQFPVELIYKGDKQ